MHPWLEKKAERAEISKARAAGEKVLQNESATAGSPPIPPGPKFVLIQPPDEELRTSGSHDLKNVRSMEFLGDCSKG